MNSCSEGDKLSSGKAASLKSLVGPMLIQNCLLVPQIIGVSVSCILCPSGLAPWCRKSSGAGGEANQSFWDTMTVLTWYSPLADKPNEPQLS